ncbi:argininosuccinate lyase [Paenibacillus sp. NEAU-GSW1]|uniref:argininosuccinate lyase n=1 Tax=Paenibacillus sp. NEAU-GSW1 TaxID=2682486 RepID=UPI0012E32543|nr:argininosuccinate lyase [Paenibacillus sp. NEAU-GSW1]MUT65245.1 argininosuccinate lyase [Paenibacillus sp. NEAU-GSW1]
MAIKRQWRATEDEGKVFPGLSYARTVLAPAYGNAKRQLLEPMIAIHKAHLIMLRERGLMRNENAQLTAKALLGLDIHKLRSGTYTGKFEDLFFEVEQQLLELSAEASGNLHLARSRNDMGIAIYRIVLREKLAATMDAALELHDALRRFADKHAETIMIAHTHTQQAQPTTIGHYAAAVTDSLARDIRRLKSAYEGCNASSMGAAALTTSGFAISRERVAELLGFNSVIENSYDAVSGADYVGETASAVQLAAIGLGRFAQELLLWCMQEFAVAKVAAPYVQISSIMPQKRNPVSVEHVRSLLSSAAGDAQTVLAMIHNTPFGDIVDTEDDLQPYAWRSLSTLEAVYGLLAKVIDTLEIDKDVLRKRAYDSFATVTELADTLVREEGLSFRLAHSIVSKFVAKAAERGERVRGLSLSSLKEAAAAAGLKQPLKLSAEAFHLALDPERFVRIRTLRGGPAPEELRRALGEQAKRQAEHRAWLEEEAQKQEAAMKALDDILTEWTAEKRAKSEKND